MEESKKPKTTAEVLLKNSLSDWKEIVWQYNRTDFKFWEDSWNDEFETELLVFVRRPSTQMGLSTEA